MSPAERARELPANPIQAIAAAARRRRALGRPVVDLSVGEPDFAPPPGVAEAAASPEARRGAGYPPPEGIVPLRLALLRGLAAEGLGYRSRELLVTAGASGATSAAFRALLAPGEGVLVPTPAYGAYAAQVALAGGVAVPVPTRRDGGWRLTPESLAAAAAASPGARLLVLNDPANPTGEVYLPEELDALADAIARLGLFVVCDEVYRDFVYEGPPAASLLARAPSLRGRALVVRSFSKSYGMTGWRVGFAAGPAEVIAAMLRVQQISFIAPAAPSQWAALAALEAGEAWVRVRVAEYAVRRRWVRERLGSLPGITVGGGRGAFFAFPEISAPRAPGGSAEAFCRRLLVEHDLAVVPGAAFGAPAALRLSFAAEPAALAEGLERLATALEEVRDGLAA